MPDRVSTSYPCCSQEDIDHWLKYGTVRHCEWFMGGERLQATIGCRCQSAPDCVRRLAARPTFQR